MSDNQSRGVLYKCNSCGGTYYPVQADGMLYFHACPPDTPEPRDENIVAGGANAPVRIKSDGLGVTVVGEVSEADAERRR